MKKDDHIDQRHKAIKELIATHAVPDQESLIRLLKLNYNIDTTQAVVSRDLRNLSASKTLVGGKMVYELKTIDPTKEILRLGVMSIEHNESLIVIKSLPGLAAFVADYLDAHDKALQILGTMAGENTVFVAPKSIKKIKNIYISICKLLHIKVNKDVL